MAQYTRTTTVDAAPGGDTVKQAVLDVDTDLTGIVAGYNAHDIATTAIHGVGAGTVCGTTLTQTLTLKTIVSPVITGGTISTQTTIGGLTCSQSTTGFTITGGASKVLTLTDNATLPSATTFASSAEIITGTEAAKAAAPDQIALAKAAGYFGLVQVQHAVVTAVVSGTTTMPMDDSIPANTEGFEVITCAITPKSAANKLLIIANIPLLYASTDVGSAGIALFQDTTAPALAAISKGRTSGATSQGHATLVYSMVAGTVAATTFKIRAGANDTGTIYANSQYDSGTRIFAGVSAMTLTVFEFGA